MRRLSSCGTRAQLLCGMWDPPRPGLKPVSPALAGRFSTTAPAGKPRGYSLLWCAGFSLRWLLLLWSTGSRASGLQQLWCTSLVAVACGLYSAGSVVVAHGLSCSTGLVAPRHVRSSRIRDQTHVPCVGRRILNHCTTREVQTELFLYGKKEFFLGTDCKFLEECNTPKILKWAKKLYTYLVDRSGALTNALWVIARFLSKRRQQTCQDELSLFEY